MTIHYGVPKDYFQELVISIICVGQNGATIYWRLRIGVPSKMVRHVSVLCIENPCCFYHNSGGSFLKLSLHCSFGMKKFLWLIDASKTTITGSEDDVIM